MCELQSSSHQNTRLKIRNFGNGTREFSASEDSSVVVCLLPGAELILRKLHQRLRPWPWSRSAINYRTAIFRQINDNNPRIHDDALEFPEGQQATSFVVRRRPISEH
jgi:hypothetical protein